MGKRRMNGEGTVYRRSEDGGWRGKLAVGIQPNGATKFRYVTARTKTEALNKLHDLRRQLEGGIDVGKRVTVAELAKKWLSERSERVGARTLELYTYFLSLALPDFARLEAARVMPGHIEVVVHRIGQDSGAATANRVRRVLFGLFRYAVRQRHFVHNPVAGVDLLKETAREITIWSHDEASRFMSTVVTHRLYALFHLAIETGLRKGEIQALRWSDILGGKAVVTRTVTRVGGGLRFSPPKTKNGRRIVALAPETLKVLAEHRRRQEVEKARATAHFNELGYVFCNVMGSMFTLMALHHVFRRLQESAGVPAARFHELRHLNVSLLIEHGVSPEVIAKRVGHKDGAYTLARYTHVFEASKRNAAVALSALLGEPLP